MQVQVLSCALSQNAVVRGPQRFLCAAPGAKCIPERDFRSRKAAPDPNPRAFQLLAPR